jgi:hypothetical protein
MSIHINLFMRSILAAALALGTTVAAADPADVATLLAQFRQASGAAAWTSINTLHIVTAADKGGERVLREHWEDVATGRYTVSETSASGMTQVGFDGLTFWRHGHSGIGYTLGDVDSALVAADEAFRVSRAWWFRDRHAATIALIGQRSENGRDFDVLGVTPEGGRLFEAWIDRSSHLLFRIDEQQAEDREVTTYADYRPVSGLMIPFSVRSGDGKDPSFDDVETVQSVEVNPKIADPRYSVPALPPTDVQLPSGRDSVEVKFRLAANNRILIPFTLNGRLRVDAEFDSGGSLLLQPDIVQKLGVVSAGRQKQSGGGEGSTSSKAGRLDSLDVGDARVSAPFFDSFAFDPGEPDLALVGLELLQRFVVRFDFDQMVMTLIRPDAFRYDGRGAVVPFHFQDNQPEVKGSIDGIAGLFAIDTGDDSSLLLIAPFAQRYGLVERYSADVPYEGKAISATHGVWARKRVAVVSLDGADGRPVVEVHEPVTRISLQHEGFDANRNVSANIGIGILRQFNLTFDYPRQRLILEPNHFFGQRDVFNRTGLRLKRDPAGWTITNIYPGSPAAQAGLKAGDYILTINGRTASELSGDELDGVLKGPVGTTLSVKLRTAIGRRSATLELRDVF